MTDKTFIKVTNKEIYEEIKDLHKKLDKVLQKQRISFWMAGIALGAVSTLIGFFFEHLNK